MSDSTEAAEPRRTRGVVLVSILLSLIGIQGLVLVALTLLGYPMPRTAQTALGEATVLRSLDTLGPWWQVGIGAGGAAVFLPLAVGFWLMRRWAWVGTMIAASITITAHVLARLVGGLDTRWTWSAASLVLTIGVVFYLNLNAVQRRFRAPDPERPPATVIRGDLE